MKKNKLSVIDAIGAVLDGKPFVPSMDSLQVDNLVSELKKLNELSEI